MIITVDSKAYSSSFFHDQLPRIINPSHLQGADATKSLRFILSSLSVNSSSDTTSNSEHDDYQHVAPPPRLINSGRIVFPYIGRDLMPFPTLFNSTDLVLGLAFDIDAAHLAIFSYSFRKHAPDAVVILFINFDVTAFPMVETILTRTRVLCVQIAPARLTPPFIRTFHPSSLRWILYDRLLNSAIVGNDTIYINQDKIDDLYMYRAVSTDMNATTTSPTKPAVPKTLASLFNKIIALDVRDSAFQSNPFSLIPDVPPYPETSTPPVFNFRHSHRHSLYAFAEDLTLPLGQCGWNSGWVNDCFGGNTLGVIFDNFVICSGVSMGFVDVMHVYVHYMSLLLRGKKIRLNPRGSGEDLSYDTYNYLNNERHYKSINNYDANSLPAPRVTSQMNNERILTSMNSALSFPQCERNGVDQGMHNVLIFLNVIPVKIYNYQNFPVINLQSALTEHNFLHSNKLLLLSQMSKLPYAIVHQYDRFDVYQKDLVDTYISWIDTSNPLQELKTNPTCSPYKRVQGVDVMHGMCDLKSQNVISIGACCDLCFKMNNPDQHVASAVLNNTADMLTSYANKVCTGFTFDGQKCFFKKCSEEVIFKAYTDLKMSIHYMSPGDQEIIRTRNIHSFFLPFSKPELLQKMKSLPFLAEYFSG